MRRILLFDIDGTLIWGGPAKDAFCQAMEETYGTVGAIDSVSFAGKTDPQIARMLLTPVGFEGARIEAGLEELFGRYLGYMEDRIDDHPVDVLPGVEALLDALAGERDVGLGLLTGNIHGGARIKLGSAGLWERFAFGSYGSDHEIRDELPAIALGRARELFGDGVEAEDAVVIGDTPRDVACGKAGGMRTIAVATGSFSAEQLNETGADRVLSDFGDTAETVAALLA